MDTSIYITSPIITGTGGSTIICIALTPTGASPSTTLSQEARTSWYNYALASAGTITGTNNTTTATQSICPKGWTLPSQTQIDTIGGASPGSTTYIGSFSPVLGGLYNNGTLYSESAYGRWWGSTAYNGASRYYLYYDGNSLYTYGDSRRNAGFYVRCVSEEKDVSDLTYMQDMTPSVAANTAEGTTASLTDRRDGKVYTVAKINGNMWMTQNLRLGYNSSNPDTYTLDLTEQDSNITFTSAERTAGKRTLTLYDLVSRGKNTSGSNQCYGTYDSTSGTGTGSGYSNSCIHSGTIANVDVNTSWYNYTLASAGTITGTNNTTTATQSICPKGWTLPNKDQIDTLSGGSSSSTYVPSFSPVLGGIYINGQWQYVSERGNWWGSESYSGVGRYYLQYIGGNLYTAGYPRRYGSFYIRCIQAS